MPESSNFVLRTIDGFASQLTGRNPLNVDEERFEVSSATDVSHNMKYKNCSPAKLGTFSGVWVPTTLNVLSILMFLRFGFILGQAGVVGMMGLLIVSYVINLITTLSVSAISSNGTVRGGGAYYLISRSLGPEFGGSIGLVFYLGFVFNTGLNAVGLVDCVINNFGTGNGSMSHIFPESFWLRYLYATIVLVLCTVICLLGSAIFSRASSLLLGILLIATLSIPISTLVVPPFYDHVDGISYTGLSMQTLKENILPNFTKGAAGSQSPKRENWQNLFGLLFPATAGIFAGASMSGDLKNPSKSIPSGTLNGLLFTFIVYSLVIISMAASIERETLYTNLNIIQDINASPQLILMGEFATSFFSALMGVIGSAKSLQALARDDVFPGLSIFGQGTASTDEPIIAIIFTYLLSQLTLFADINTIASVVTMTYLVTFWVTNMACFLLKIGSAPNFRPTFKFFTWWTAGSGAVLSVVTMFFVDGFYASGIVGIILALFLIIHYTTPPKSWGDVSQSLIYHQVRKYLLRLRQEHVKFWRPQILLFVNDPRRSWKLIQFCNAMKKGGLYVLGHIIVTTEFQDSFAEVKRQQDAWMKYIDFTKVKAFPQVAISPSVEWGARNVVLSAGLGGMRPNIAVLGFYNLEEFRDSRPLVDVPSQTTPDTTLNHEPMVQINSNNEIHGHLPTDDIRPEKAVGATSYVNILEDLLLCLQMNVAIAKGFNDLELPKASAKNKYIDLWPIQMSAESDSSENCGNILTTNFDTYTLILQLGCILNTVPAWKRTYKVRVAVFVEFETDVQEESMRVKRLLENLRIQAKVVVVWLASGDLCTYEVIVNGAEIPGKTEIDEVLDGEAWWQELQNSRKNLAVGTGVETSQFVIGSQWPNSSYQQHGYSDFSLSGRPKKQKRTKRRHSLSEFVKIGMPHLNMRTHRLNSDVFAHESSFEMSSDTDSDDSMTSNDMRESSFVDVEQASAPETTKASRATTSEAIVDSWVPRITAKPPPMRALHPETGNSTATSETFSPGGALLNSIETSSLTRPRPTTPAFSCNAIPETRVSLDDGPGPSVMFTEADNVPIPTENGEGRTAITAQRHSLSFNDLPSSGQHLILNELMKRHSDSTAVIFTTLPSPQPGTCKSEPDSLAYLQGLEALTTGLPPVLLVHSNSLTVTTSL